MGSRSAGTPVDKKKAASDKARADANAHEGTTVMHGTFTSENAGKFEKFNAATDKVRSANEAAVRANKSPNETATVTRAKPLMSDFGIPEKKKKKLG